MSIIEASNMGIHAEVDEEDIYMTEDGYLAVEFWYHRVGDADWRVYILSDIDYKGKDTGSYPSHTHDDATTGFKYISYETIKTKAEAKAVSADWADLTAHYIQTGTRF